MTHPHARQTQKTFPDFGPGRRALPMDAAMAPGMARRLARALQGRCQTMGRGVPSGSSGTGGAQFATTLGGMRKT